MVKRDLAAETCRMSFFLVVDAYNGLLEWSVRLLPQRRLMMPDKVPVRTVDSNPFEHKEFRLCIGPAWSASIFCSS